MSNIINRNNFKKMLSLRSQYTLGELYTKTREKLTSPYLNYGDYYTEYLPTEETLACQRSHPLAKQPLVSIVVPAYETPELFLRQMVDSVVAQTYGNWELCIADGSVSSRVEQALREQYEGESRIRYRRLPQNGGISENTNRGFDFAQGTYLALLDHDDLLTEDALYEMASAVSRGGREGRRPGMLYSDEDKCDQEGKRFFEPNLKEDFNLDLLLSNNYICHFLVMRRELMQSLGFRPEYDGAQDHDLALRAAGELLERGEAIGYVPKVLYHWRSHSASTAENPRSKLYAYEAGRRAIQDFAQARGWRASVEETAHVGFYALRYEGGVFCQRPDIGAVGGRVLRRGRTEGGRLTEEGEILYAGLPKGYSGYLHRAVLPQDAAAVDIRNIRVRQECRELFERVTGIPYRTVPGGERFDASLLPGDCDYVDMSLRLGRALREAGYRVLYLPEEER